jgi:phosphate uptake regulator
MKRKIIKQANQAYTITLPIEWVRQNNLDKTKNLEVDVSLLDKSLIISNLGRTEIKKKTLDITEFNGRAITRIIQALYAKGIDELELISKKDISSDLVRGLRDTIGFALVSQEKDKYIIKDMGGGNYSDLDEIFKRVYQMILLYYESAIKDIFGKEQETLESNDSRDAEINKFCLFLERAISKMSYPDPINGRVLFAYSFCLEKIGDEIHRMWRTNIKYNIKKTAQIKELTELSNEGLSKAFEFYYQFNPNKAEEIYNLREKVREKSLSFSKTDAHTLRFIRHAVKIIEEAGDFSQLTLMKNL